MKLNFSGLIIFANDTMKLKHFYAHILNLPVLEEMDDVWVLLKAGNAEIALHKVGEQYLTPGGSFNAESNTKMVFEVDDDIISLRQHLLDNNIKVKEIKTFDNYDYWICDGEDFEGNVFQLKQKKTVLKNDK